MVPIVLAVIFAGRTATIVGVALLSVFGFKEFARATGLYRDWWMTGAVYLGILAVAATSLVPDPLRDTPGWYGLFMTLPVYVVSLILVVPIVRNRAKGQLQNSALAVLGFIYLGWMFSHIGFLANARHAYGYLLFLFLAVEGNDIAAFVFGKLLGRRKLCPEISPNKTWGGSLGALAVSMVLPWLMWFSFPHFGPLQLVLTGVDRRYRWAARRSDTQHDQAGRRREGHGRADPRSWRAAGSYRQPDLRRPSVLPHGALVLRLVLTGEYGRGRLVLRTGA